MTDQLTLRFVLVVIVLAFGLGSCIGLAVSHRALRAELARCRAELGRCGR